eukprot:773622-Prorocentrum_lima.AAC.1
MAAEHVAAAWTKHVHANAAVSDAITAAFVDSALTMYDRLLSDPICKEEVDWCEDLQGKRSVWDS